MKNAWAMVRRAQDIFGGPARQYIAEALRIAWRELNGSGLILEYRSLIADIREQKSSARRLYRSSRYRAAYYAASW